MLFSANDASGALLGWAALITATGGVIGILGGLINQWRRGAKRSSVPNRDDADVGSLWQEMLEQLDAASERAERAERALELCNRERLDLLRRAAKHR